MKKSYLISMSIVVLFLFGYLYKTQNNKLKKLQQQVETLRKDIDTLRKNEEKLKKELEKSKKQKVTKSIPIHIKKDRFIKMVLPKLDEVYGELKTRFLSLKKDIETNNITEEIKKLKKFYSVDTNEELLYALKPHPKSIALAQSAMESAWGQSRFFKKANNLFGVWSFNKNEPRVAASDKRGTKTVWLKKYPSIKESIKDYYTILSRSPSFKTFRKLNYENKSPYLLVTKLDSYSEKREKYGKELSSMIKFNNFTKYDDKDFNIKQDEKKLTKEEVKKEALIEEKAIEEANNEEVTTSKEVVKDKIVNTILSK